MNPNLTGILLVNKPSGRTSFSLVASLRRRLGVRCIGHAGTLDPLASGVMVMLVGREYTRLSDTFLNHDKEYVATLHLGVSTDSYDADGVVMSESAIIPTLEEIQQALSAFQGQHQQVPPMFSAKKQNGKKLYELARKGEVVERKAVTVQLETHLVSFEYPYLKLRVKCSKGTYIRSLAHDLGQILGCGAHLCKLERTRSGPFHVDSCIAGADSDFDAICLKTALQNHTTTHNPRTS